VGGKLPRTAEPIRLDNVVARSMSGDIVRE
jgi:hypothetical protein